MGMFTWEWEGIKYKNSIHQKSALHCAVIVWTTGWTWNSAVNYGYVIHTIIKKLHCVRSTSSQVTLPIEKLTKYGEMSKQIVANMDLKTAM